MAGGLADISQQATRWVLDSLGRVWMQKRGYEKIPKGSETSEIFNGCCPYCDLPLAGLDTTIDHIVAINQALCGLHVPGNRLKCCRKCNHEKGPKPWLDWLEQKAGDDFPARRNRIQAFMLEWRYQPLEGVGLSMVRDQIQQKYQELRNFAVLWHASSVEQCRPYIEAAAQDVSLYAAEVVSF